jgi:hypothetical protein
MNENWVLKQKSRPGRDSCDENRRMKLRRGLRQRPDAACAQYLTNQAPVFKNGNFLQVGAESPAGSTLREAAVVAKAGGLSTSITLCHCSSPF